VGLFRRRKPKTPPAPVKQPSAADDKTERYQSLITRWVEWYRGVNDPDVHRKVAEKQIGLLTADKNISHYDIVYGGHQRPRATLYVSDLRALAALQWALARMFPKKQFEVHEDEDVGKKLCQYCGSLVRVPCTASRARQCANRPRGRK
jgi:hypothetical protein